MNISKVYEGSARCRRDRIKGLVFYGKWILCACLGLAVQPLRGQPIGTADPRFWMPDGAVNTLLITNNIAYLGGDFTYVGPRTGPASLFSQTTGQWLGAPARIAGNINVILADGSGGWYLGGSFTRIGTTAITNLARLNPDLSVDSRWNANLAGVSVNALVLDNGRLYIGGQFSRLGGQTVSGLAGVDESDASLVWNPHLTGTVNAMQVNGELLYVGGQFATVGSLSRQNIAAISTTTAVATDWAPGANQAILALAVSGNTIFVGGQFTTAGTKPRNRLAALDEATGVATTWNPNPNGIVRALAVTDGVVYAGGDFTSMGAQSRRGFAAVSSQDGALQALNLQLESAGTADLVRSILLQGNSLYVGGAFIGALGTRHRLVVGVDLSSGSPLPVSPASELNGAAGAAFGANALALANGTILVGGDFESFGGAERQRAAALSLSTGALLPWAPTFNASVTSLAFGTNRIYVGGGFTNFNGTNLVRGLVAVDPENGSPAPFRFLATNQTLGVTVNALAVAPDSLYVGGAFTVVSGQPRRFLAALDPATGEPITNFNAKLGGGSAGVNSLVLAGEKLYVAGDFTTVNAVANARLAAVSATDGTSLKWTPKPNRSVDVLAANEENLYVSGQFTQIGDATLNKFAAFSLADNSLLGFDAAMPTTAGGITAMGATPTCLYVAGSFPAIGGEFRANLACLGPVTVAAYDWNPSPDVAPSVIALTENWVLLGGGFRFWGTSSAKQLNPFLAAFPRAPQIVATSLTSTNTIRMVATTGDLHDTVIQATPNLLNPEWTNIATNPAPGFWWNVEFTSASPQNRFFRAVARAQE